MDEGPSEGLGPDVTVETQASGNTTLPTRSLVHGDTPRAWPGEAISLPESVGRYRIKGTLGEGGMGMVLRGYDESLERSVAIKLLRTDAGGREAAHQRMRREAKALARLSHPNVVGVHETGIHGDQLFIAMEYVEGQDLRDWFSEERTFARTIEVFTAAGRALEAAHAADVVHRDFKPENVRIGSDGRVKVLDFGLAVSSQKASTSGFVHSALTNTGQIMGTPAYMAPEQFSASGTDARTDQFAFCVALHEALYGFRPFAGGNFVSLGLAVKSGSVTPEPEDRRLPPRLRAVILRGLSVDPDARYPDMGALLTELHEAIADPPRRRLIVPVAVAVAVVLALVTVAVLLKS